jgi:hypothetical protein
MISVASRHNSATSSSFSFCFIVSSVSRPRGVISTRTEGLNTRLRTYLLGCGTSMFCADLVSSSGNTILYVVYKHTKITYYVGTYYCLYPNCFPLDGIPRKFQSVGTNYSTKYPRLMMENASSDQAQTGAKLWLSCLKIKISPCLW